MEFDLILMYVCSKKIKPYTLKKKPNNMVFDQAFKSYLKV
jgi:hypothetical protein